MEITTGMIVAGTILSLGAGLGAAFFYYKRRNQEKFFNQVYLEMKRVPSKKKNSFLLLMFKESLAVSLKKSSSSAFGNKLQNPKFLDVQLVQMSNILKDPTKVQDKLMLKALKLYKDYQAWEKEKNTKEQAEVQKKAS